MAMAPRLQVHGMHARVSSQQEETMSTLDPNGSPSNTGATIVGSGGGEGPVPDVMGSDTLEGNKVVTSDGEDVGKISDIMLDVRNGRIAYAVLSEGGFLGVGTGLPDLPWGVFPLDTEQNSFC